MDDIVHDMDDVAGVVIQDVVDELEPDLIRQLLQIIIRELEPDHVQHLLN